MENKGSHTLGWIAGAAVLVALAAFVVGVRARSAAEEPRSMPSPAYDPPQSGLQVAVLAGGCFWGVEGVYEHLKGVRKVESGYAGGDAQSADYERVSSGSTGHAESVQVVFDPSAISYGEILRVFFSVAHDPTQVNRQGPDIGPQYRSAIFYVDEAQQTVAARYIAQLEQAKVFQRSIATRLDKLDRFYPAEPYHQDFMAKNPSHPYIAFHDVPKVAALKELFPDRYVDPASTVD